MSLYEYRESLLIAQKDFGFYALIMAAMLKAASTDNMFRLQRVFPETWIELQKRYHAPGGFIEGDEK